MPALSSLLASAMCCAKVFFACGEKQQTPLLNLSARLATIVSACFAGAVAEHVHGFANDAGGAHADFVEYQEAVRVRGSNGFQCVIGRAP